MSPQILPKQYEPEMNAETKLKSNTSEDSSSVSKPMVNYNKASLRQRMSNFDSYQILESSNEYKKLISNVEDEFILADLGCSHGYNTISLFKEMIQDMYTINPKLNFRVHLNDLPSNDFSAVFQCLNDKEISYLFLPHFETSSHNLNPKQVLTFVNGDSFYKKLFPDQSHHFITSLFTLHWLPSSPPLLHTVNPNGVDLSEQERKVYSDIAESSLNLFLQFRAQELKKDGILMFNVLRSITLSNFIDSEFKKYIRTQSLDITQFQDLVLPLYWRTEKEIFEGLELVKDQFKLLEFKTLTPHGNITFEFFQAILTFTFKEGLKRCKVLQTEEETLQFLDGFMKVLKNLCPRDDLEKDIQLVILQKK